MLVLPAVLLLAERDQPLRAALPRRARLRRSRAQRAPAG